MAGKGGLILLGVAAVGLLALSGTSKAAAPAPTPTPGPAPGPAPGPVPPVVVPPVIYSPPPAVPPAPSGVQYTDANGERWVVAPEPSMGQWMGALVSPSPFPVPSGPYLGPGKSQVISQIDARAAAIKDKEG